MKLTKTVALSLMVSLSSALAIAQDSTKAPPSIALNYLEYCQDILAENDGEYETNLLNCVNTELEDAGFDTFTTYRALLAYVGQGED